MPRRPNLTQEQKDYAAEKRERFGWSYKRIAAELGVSHKSIEWCCLAMGAESPKPARKRMTVPDVRMRKGRPVRRFTATDDAKIVELSADGKGPCEIARALGRKHVSIIGRMMRLAKYEEATGA